MSANREEDKKINEMYLNQDAIGLQQQRDPNGNLKYPAKYDKRNSNLRQFDGLAGYKGKASDARIATSVDLSSDEEKDRKGYVYKSEQTLTTPENPEVIVFGLGKYDLESLQSNIRKELEDLSKDNINNIIYKLTDKYSALVHKVKALDEIQEEMDTPQYKKKITLAKRKRSSYNLKYGND